MGYYTHWAYFRTKEQAESCMKDLPGYRFRLDGPEEDLRDDWLLRAEQEVPDGRPAGWRDAMENAVRLHGGAYDGGESTFGPGGNIPDPHMADPQHSTYPTGLQQFTETLGTHEDRIRSSIEQKAEAEDRVMRYLDMYLADYVADNGPLSAPVMEFMESPMNPQDEEKLISSGLAVMGSGRHVLQTVIKLMRDVRRIEMTQETPVEGTSARFTVESPYRPHIRDLLREDREKKENDGLPG